ncbi:hypothetical protein BC831DRAFT_117891 [Entophlyctis helioformis]|nr:hypothetical protein BC831DRAFT_117891 [Entophlyctis helioformis]
MPCRPGVWPDAADATLVGARTSGSCPADCPLACPLACLPHAIMPSLAVQASAEPRVHLHERPATNGVAAQVDVGADTAMTTVHKPGWHTWHTWRTPHWHLTHPRRRCCSLDCAVQPTPQPPVPTSTRSHQTRHATPRVPKQQPAQRATLLRHSDNSPTLCAAGLPVRHKRERLPPGVSTGKPASQPASKPINRRQQTIFPSHHPRHRAASAPLLLRTHTQTDILHQHRHGSSHGSV